MPGTEYWLGLCFTLPGDRAWAARGHEVAWEQFRMPLTSPSAPCLQLQGLPALDLSETEAVATIAGNGFGLTFDKEQASISSLRVQDAELIVRGPRLNLWRAPTDNDVKDRRGEITWRGASLDSLHEQVKAVNVEQPEPHIVRVEAQTIIAPVETDPAQATALYEYFVEQARRLGASVQTGRFRARMEVALINDGPVTLILESRS